MKTPVLAFWIIILALFLSVPVLVSAAPVGRVTRVEGMVDVLKPGRTVVNSVSPGDSVDVGDIYRAKTNGRAEITFFNKNILRIAPATRVQISRYSSEGNRSSQIMKLERGRVEAISGEEFLKKVSSFAEGNKFEVHTPNAVAGIRGSGMTVGFAQMITGLFFSTGRGYFYNPANPGRVVNVTAGHISFIAGTGLPSIPIRGNARFVGGSGSPGGGQRTGTGSLSGMVSTASSGSSTSVYVFTQQRIDVPTNTMVSTTPVLGGSTDFVYTGGVGHGLTTGFKMQNVKFYGPSATAVPQTWSVAGNITGIFDTAYSAGTNVLTGSNATSLTMTHSLSAGQWNASVSGSAPHGIGTTTKAFVFDGTASGKYNEMTGGVVSGTASGTAKTP
jgi:hypothetical protein